MSTTVNGGVSQMYSQATVNALKNYQSSEYASTYKSAGFSQSIFNTSGYTASLSGSTAGTGKTNTSSFSSILNPTMGTQAINNLFKSIQSPALGQSSIFEQRLNGEAGAFYGKTTSYFRSTTSTSSADGATSSSVNATTNKESVSKAAKSDSVSDLMGNLGTSFSLMA